MFVSVVQDILNVRNIRTPSEKRASRLLTLHLMSDRNQGKFAARLRAHKVEVRTKRRELGKEESEELVSGEWNFAEVDILLDSLKSPDADCSGLERRCNLGPSGS